MDYRSSLFKLPEKANTYLKEFYFYRTDFFFQDKEAYIGEVHTERVLEICHVFVDSNVLKQ